MKAITTKYLPSTNTKGSRIKAYDEDGNSVIISYPYGLSTPAAHHEAAIALCEKMQWSKNIVGGGTTKGYVFVFVK